MFAVQFSADWFSSWRAVWKSSPFVQYGGPSIVETRRHTQKPLGYRFLRRVGYKNNRCEFWYLFLFYFIFYFFTNAFCCRPRVFLWLVSALERAFTQRTALARVDKVPVPTARGPLAPLLCFFVSFSPRWIVSLVYWAVSFPAAGAAADAVCCLLAETRRRGEKTRGREGVQK